MLGYYIKFKDNTYLGFAENRKSIKTNKENAYKYGTVKSIKDIISFMYKYNDKFCNDNPIAVDKDDNEI